MSLNIIPSQHSEGLAVRRSTQKMTRAWQSGPIAMIIHKIKCFIQQFFALFTQHTRKATIEIEASPSKPALVAKDPFNIRARVAGTPSVQSLPDPTDLGAMSKYISDNDMAEGPRRPFTYSGDVPDLFNFVWVGSELPDKYKANIEAWREINPNSELVVWTDQNDLSPKMKAWCQEKGVRLINLYKSLPDETWMGTKDPFTLQMTKTQPNYGEASDLARYVLLYNLGGRYFDTDANPSYMKEGSEKNTTLPADVRLVVYRGWGNESAKIRANDAFIARPKSPVFKEVIERCVDNYSLSYDELVGHRSLNGRSRQVMETVLRTGPQVIQQTLKYYVEHSPEDYEIETTDNFSGEGDASWVVDYIKPMGRAVTTGDTHKILSEVLWDLQNDPDTLNLQKYERWIGDQEQKSGVMNQILTYVSNYPESLSRVTTVITDDPELKTKAEALI